jgi:hypothetical protein
MRKCLIAGVVLSALSLAGCGKMPGGPEVGFHYHQHEATKPAPQLQQVTTHTTQQRYGRLGLKRGRTETQTTTTYVYKRS